MTNRDSIDNKGSIPPRWLHCPRKSVKLIQNKFMIFKTPLSNAFDSQVAEECRFTVDMLFASLKSQKLKLGLWIDLTNTSRFYDKSEVESNDCKYVKVPCRGHGETPPKDVTKLFVELCKKFISKNPLGIIGVHCTHGFNRSGFLIISYLIEMDNFNMDAALVEFSTARPPGIYKDDYIKELYTRYDDVDDAPPPPPRPAWCLEYDDDDVEDRDEEFETESSGSSQPPLKRRKREYINKNPTFMVGVPGVTPVTDTYKLSGIQRRVQEICKWESSGFPGSQPVSMGRDNIKLIHQKPYMVSWKADGTRYMMLIQGDEEVYFIDRDNSVFQVSDLAFPHPRETTRRLRDTLLDGEMVIDRVSDKEYPRYLAYDIIMYDGNDVSKLSFHPERYGIIENDVMGGRYRALREGRLKREREPFSVRSKQFWDVTQAKSLLSEKFAKQLSHEPDGLIFQPSKEPYVTGTSREVLKWKPSSMNSVDFRLKIVIESGVDRTVHVWCTKDLLLKERKSLRININYDYATHVRVSPDGKAFIIHKSLGNNVEVYGLKKKTTGFFTSAISVLEFPKRHEEDIVGMDIACNGRFIITCSKTNDLIVWDLKGEPFATIDTYLGSTYQARVSPCGRFVAASGFTPDIKVWEVGFGKTGDFKQIGKAFDLAGHSSGVYDFNFCADSSAMASLSKDGTYRFYDTKIEFEKGEDPHLLISGQWDNASSGKLALSPSGEVLVIAHGTTLSFYSTISGQLDTTIEDNGFVSCMTFDASGEFLLVAVDKQIRIFRNVTGHRVAIESARRKLEQRQTSATKERLEKIIVDSMKFLEAMGEQVTH